MQHAPMSRARYMQENRKMRFTEALEGWTQGRLQSFLRLHLHLCFW